MTLEAKIATGKAKPAPKHLAATTKLSRPPTSGKSPAKRKPKPKSKKDAKRDRDLTYNFKPVRRPLPLASECASAEMCLPAPEADTPRYQHGKAGGGSVPSLAWWLTFAAGVARHAVGSDGAPLEGDEEHV